MSQVATHREWQARRVENVFIAISSRSIGEKKTGKAIVAQSLSSARNQTTAMHRLFRFNRRVRPVPLHLPHREHPGGTEPSS